MLDTCVSEVPEVYCMCLVVVGRSLKIAHLVPLFLCFIHVVHKLSSPVPAPPAGPPVMALLVPLTFPKICRTTTLPM